MRNSVVVFRFGVSFPILVKSTLLHEKARCVCRKLDSAILMVKAAKDRS
jgi:hypothetical protein